MSLSLLQGYSSAEEGESPSSSSDEDAPSREPPSFNPNAAGSLLPSAFDAFSQVSGPPQFLINSAQHQSSIHVSDTASFRRRRDLPPGAVVEAKAQLVGIHERVRSDIEGNAPTSSTDATSKGSSANLPEGVKRIVTATNPDAKDASELLMSFFHVYFSFVKRMDCQTCKMPVVGLIYFVFLRCWACRMCLQCGVPKTYTNARGMVCPECGDRPPSDEALKKKGSTVKDKEKVKRMRGQSSHASWKSETEMHLRQQFD